MNDQEFDTFVRNKLNNASASASTNEKLMHTWSVIEVGLARQHKRSVTVISFSIAASMLLLALVIVYTTLTNASEEKLSYRQEAIEESSTGAFANDVLFENEILSSLEQKCQIKSVTCRTEEFHQLKSELAELDEKEKEIQIELRRYGQAPSVLKALTKIRIMKTDVLKKLLKL